MKILHTSDWHLGRNLYGHKRHEEYKQFLSWLLLQINARQVEVLLVAGDIFDSVAPGNQAQELYYHFLSSIKDAGCRHVVIIGGNHDSPSFLNAPQKLLKNMNIHVMGAITDNLQDEILTLTDPDLIVCAVPYLRDKDIRAVLPGESMDDKERGYINALNSHYAQVEQLALQQRAKIGENVPIIAMGHLFARGGKTVAGDGVRGLYVGNLAQVAVDVFSKHFAYVALGHLHVPQAAAKSENIRYSGSPLPIGFDEGGKSVCLVEIDNRQTRVSPLAIPVFQELARVRGDLDEIRREVKQLAERNSAAWVEIIYEGADMGVDVAGKLAALAANSRLNILRIKNNRIIRQIMDKIHDDPGLDDLEVRAVFKYRLRQMGAPETQIPEILSAFEEIMQTLAEKADI
jgi:exonuclease SbcD